MAGNSAVTWAEVTGMVGTQTALWTSGSRPPGFADSACLTWAEFRAHVLNDGGGVSSPALITLDEFTLRRVLAPRLTWTLSPRNQTSYILAELDAGGVPLRNTSILSTAPPTLLGLPATRIAEMYQKVLGSGVSGAVEFLAAAHVLPGQTWNFNNDTGVWTRQA